jgi:hypothetical protein
LKKQIVLLAWLTSSENGLSAQGGWRTLQGSIGASNLLVSVMATIGWRLPFLIPRIVVVCAERV